jgi:predicted metal-dependent peptidase
MTNRGKLDDTLAAMFSNIEYRQNYLFYAHMVGQCSIKVTTELEAPAGVAFNVDHYDLYINPEQFDEYTLVERLAILKHEMLHILMDHVGRAEDRVHLPWNFATDCAINQQIDPDHLPEIAVTPETLGKMMESTVPANQSSEFYYDMIKDHVKDKQKDGQPGEGEGEGGSGSESGNPSEGDGQCKPLDSHEIWDESKGDKDLKKDMTKKMIEKAQEDTIKSKGYVPSECSEWIEMHSRKNEVSWKKVLRGIVGNKRVGVRSTIMRQDRRFPKREDLRGKTRERKFNLLVIADVSGSMDDQAIIDTLTEVQHVCDITKTDVDLIQIDSEAFAPEKLTKKTKLIERKGNGGTELYPAIEMAQKHKIDYQAVIVLTDGGLWANDIDKFRALNKKLIWLIEPNGWILDTMNSGKMQAIKLKEREAQ